MKKSLGWKKILGEKKNLEKKKKKKSKNESYLKLPELPRNHVGVLPWTDNWMTSQSDL